MLLNLFYDILTCSANVNIVDLFPFLPNESFDYYIQVTLGII